MEQTRFRISLLDAVVLLYHVHRGAKTEGVGFEDCDRTLEYLTRSLAQFKYTVSQSALESALWSCNLMDEQGEFWCPEGKSFDDWIKNFTVNDYKYDKFYNVMEERKKRG